MTKVKPWAELSAEEKSALLLAHHRGGTQSFDGVADLEARLERAEAALATARADTIDEVCAFLRDHGSAEGHVIATIRALKGKRDL